jgi:hypothetical protein
MLFISRKREEDEPHTIVSSSLGQGKGRIETYYYGEAQAPIKPIKDFSQLRVTRGASIQEILADYTWRARVKTLFNKLIKITKSSMR